MTDMLVKLYGLEMEDLSAPLAKEGIAVCRAMAFDKEKILASVRDNFHDICPEWAAECELTLMRQPPSCFIAVHEKRVVGFCCWDASAKGMLGPLGVHADYRGKGLARELMRLSFEAMKQEGYAYAVIGWVSSEEFYEKACGAVAIEGSFPGVYQRLVGVGDEG